MTDGILPEARKPQLVMTWADGRVYTGDSNAGVLESMRQESFPHLSTWTAMYTLLSMRADRELPESWSARTPGELFRRFMAHGLIETLELRRTRPVPKHRIQHVYTYDELEREVQLADSFLVLHHDELCRARGLVFQQGTAPQTWVCVFQKVGRRSVTDRFLRKVAGPVDQIHGSKVVSFVPPTVYRYSREGAYPVVVIGINSLCILGMHPPQKGVEEQTVAMALRGNAAKLHADMRQPTSVPFMVVHGIPQIEQLARDKHLWGNVNVEDPDIELKADGVATSTNARRNLGLGAMLPIRAQE